jgi:hypothetical protein
MDATDDNTTENAVTTPLWSEFGSYQTYHYDTTVNIGSDEEYVDDDNDGSIDCVICLEPITQYSAYYFDCSHKLHTECFHRYFAYNYDVENNFICCPVCRQEMCVEIIKEKQCPKLLFRMTGTLTVCCFSVWLLLKYLN